MAVSGLCKGDMAQWLNLVGDGLLTMIYVCFSITSMTSRIDSITITTDSTALQLRQIAAALDDLPMLSHNDFPRFDHSDGLSIASTHHHSSTLHQWSVSLYPHCYRPLLRRRALRIPSPCNRQPYLHLHNHLDHHSNDGFPPNSPDSASKVADRAASLFGKSFKNATHQPILPSDCIGAKEDYLECLHHTKEIARAKEIKDHWIQRQAKEAHAAREKGEVRATSSILDLGLINDQNEGGKGKGEDKAGSGSSSGSESS